jgi:pimeloyl-ACP methyl ester carboxylesterase
MSVKRTLLIFSVLAATRCSSPAQTNHTQTTAQTLPPKTIWEGKIGAVRLILRISEDSITKQKTAVFDSPDQNAIGIAVSSLKVSNDSLVAFSKVIGQGFRGAFNADKSKAEGQWSYNGNKALMVLTRVSHITAPNRPQTPKAPFPYVQQDGIFYNKDKSLQYGYTLTIPDLKKDYPAVVMITGSGQLDRDETAFGHKIFWVIADHLSRNGIAVLRIDDRGIGKSTGNFGASTSADFAQDVLVAVDYLKNQIGIDTKKIGLIGHSEGGVIGPMAITQSKDIAFMVSMAGVGIKGSEIMFSQGREGYKKLGLKEEELLRIDTLNRMMFTLSEEYKERSALNTAFKQQMTGWLSRQPEEFLLKAGLKGPNADIIIRAKMSAMFSTWMRYFLTYDPAQYLGKITIPVLVLNGEKDKQVFAKENLAGFDKYLAQAGNKHYKTIAFPGLNHFFQHAATGEVNEYATIEETISPEVLDTITRWIIINTL